MSINFSSTDLTFYLCKQINPLAPSYFKLTTTKEFSNILGGGLKTSVVHMREQRFSKHTLFTISPLQEKHPLNENFAWFSHNFTPKHVFFFFFWGHVWWSSKNDPKCPLIESKKTLFLKNRHSLTPNRDLHKSRLASKNNPFFSHFFGCTCVCTTLLFKWPPWGNILPD